MESLPVLDFSCLSLDKDDKEIEADDITTVATNLVEAFGDIGFAYLINHGIPNEQVVNSFIFMLV